MQDSPSLVRFSDFLGIGYFGDKDQHIIVPILDTRASAKQAWERVMHAPLFHVVFVEHPNKYEFIAYPVKLNPDKINHALYRSFSSLDSLHKVKNGFGGSGRAYIKFGWHDLTKPQKFDVIVQYTTVDSAEFVRTEEIRAGMLVDQIRKS